MKTKLTKGLQPNQVEELKKKFNEGFDLRQRYREILKEDIDRLRSEMEHPEFLTTPNWDNNVIDKLSQIRATKYLISLLEN